MGEPRSLFLSLLAAVAASAGLLTTYVKTELADPDRFAERAVEALGAPAVRTVIAEQIVVEIVERESPELIATRPLVLAAIEAALETGPFERVLKRAVADAHSTILAGEDDALLELERAEQVLVPAIKRVAPGLAARVPERISPPVSEIRRSEAATWVLRSADAASAFAYPLLGLAVVLLGIALAIAVDLRTAVIRAGAVCGLTGVVSLLGLSILRETLVSQPGLTGVVSPTDAEAAAGAAWDALAGDFETWLIAFAAGGLLATAGGIVSRSGLDRAALTRRLAAGLTGGNLAPGLQMVRGLVLTSAGAALLLRTEPLHEAVVILLGAGLAMLGLAEAISALVSGVPARGEPGTPVRRRHARALIAATGVFAIGLGGYLVTRSDPSDPPPADEITACNGLAELCERRLDELVLPGTHNSMSAADRPSWFFANQTVPVPAQLDAGIRFLMLDPHYGIVDSSGRVRTDLRAEGTSRNRVVRQLGLDAVAVAEQLATRVGLVPSDGKREIFLCHTLCELGAERMSSTLDEIRGFLEQNRTEVVAVFVESSIEPEEVEAEFVRADLSTYAAELDLASPLPTLRELIESGQRLLVFDQEDGGEAPWHQPAFRFMQDTLNAGTSDTLDCRPRRGTPDAPLVLLNHWVDSVPPSPAANSAIASTSQLLARARECRRRLGRAPNLIAVDFFEQSGVINAARQMNLAGLAVEGP